MFELDSNAKHPEHGICDNINSRGRFRKKTNLSCSAVVAIELRAVGVGLRHVCAGSDRGLCPGEPTGGVDVGKGGREHVKGRFRGEGADESCDGLQRWVDWVSEHDCAWGGAGAGIAFIKLAGRLEQLRSDILDLRLLSFMSIVRKSGGELSSVVFSRIIRRNRVLGHLREQSFRHVFEPRQSRDYWLC